MNRRTFLRAIMAAVLVKPVAAVANKLTWNGRFRHETTNSLDGFVGKQSYTIGVDVGNGPSVGHAQVFERVVSPNGARWRNTHLCYEDLVREHRDRMLADLCDQIERAHGAPIVSRLSARS